ncbi:hypothetical protein SDC9_116449 [bioreactor metagenome]|uniref:Uncharacterized protein n=1 Tax=bioreactor metagenome TaxID=1076179 RepID=A0A645C6D1_9ZZZZ
MPDPECGDIVRCHAGKIDARIVRVGACFSGDRYIVDLRLGTRSGLHCVGHHVHEQPSRALLEDAAGIPHFVCIENDVALCIQHFGKRERLLIHAFVCDGCIRRRHLNRGQARCAKRESGTVNIDFILRCPKLIEILRGNSRGYVIHQDVCCRHVERAHDGAAERHRSIARIQSA